MSFASGNRVRGAYIAEAVMGTTPDTPTLKEFRKTSFNVNLAKNMVNSNEVWPDGQKRFLRHGYNFVTGTIGTELAMTEYDDFLSMSLGADWATNVLKVGTDVKTMTMERGFLDIAKYQVFTGVGISQFALSVSAEADTPPTCEFSIVGMASAALTGTPLTATPTSPGTSQPFVAFDGTLKEGGTEIAVVTSLDLTFNRNRTGKPVVGSKYSPAIFDGKAQVTGTLNAYFQDETLLNKFINETGSSLEMTFNDIGGAKSLTLKIPNLKYTGGEVNPPDDGPIVLPLPFEGLYDETDKTSLMFTRVVGGD